MRQKDLIDSPTHMHAKNNVGKHDIPRSVINKH